MNSSPDRNTFQKESAIKRAAEAGEEPDQEYIDMWEQSKVDKQAREADTAWQKNNLEYDLRSTKWICDKAKASEFYAQNLYAAMCNKTGKKMKFGRCSKAKHTVAVGAMPEALWLIWLSKVTILIGTVQAYAVEASLLLITMTNCPVTLSAKAMSQTRSATICLN